MRTKKIIKRLISFATILFAVCAVTFCTGYEMLNNNYTALDAKAITQTKNPTAVSGFKLKARSSSALRLTWTKNTSADGYIIEQKSGSTWVRIAKITKNTTTEYRVGGLKAGTAYNFRIKAYKMSGKTGLYSGYKTLSARTNPSAVSGLKLKARSSSAIRITWTKNTSADGYIIEQKSGSTWKRIAKITKNTTTEYRIGSLKAGTAYNFRVKAYKMSGNVGLHSGYKTISVRTNPSAVSGLKLKARSSSAIRLTWTKNTSADGYIIEQKSGSTWKRIAKITKNTTTEYRIGNLKAGTAYNFRIKAYKMSGKTGLYSGYTTITASTSGSSSGSSSSTVYKTCIICNGNGKCTLCSGTAKCGVCFGEGGVWSYSTFLTCPNCSGTGVCPYCEDGKCSSCDGKGKTAVTVTNPDTSGSSGSSSGSGSGSSGGSSLPMIQTCLVCGGTGLCNMCNGTNLCQVCHGRGGMSVPTYGMGGDDWVVCQGCHGSRTCEYCNGGRCKTCGGTGRR